jgi:hypothetical protein
VEAAELLAEALPGEAEAALSALDLLLRWAVLRLCDPHGNTTCLLRVLELCGALLGALADRGGQLSPFEAACFLPCLVEKAGHNQARAPALALPGGSHAYGRGRVRRGAAAQRSCESAGAYVRPERCCVRGRPGVTAQPRRRRTASARFTGSCCARRARCTRRRAWSST